MKGRKKFGEGEKSDLKHVTSVKHGGGSVGLGIYGCRNGSLMFTDDVTSDISSRMDCEVYRAILSAQLIRPKEYKLLAESPTASTIRLMFVSC